MDLVFADYANTACYGGPVKHSLKQWQLVWRTDNSPSLVFIPCHRPAGRGDGCLPHASPVSSPHPTCSALKGKKCVKAGGWLLQHLVTVVCLVDILYTIACVRGYISSPASNCPMLEETALCLLLFLLLQFFFWLPIVPGSWCASVSP